jgi:hypothetical protein
MADAQKAKLPATKPYRVSIGGAMYASPRVAQNIDGSEQVSYPVVLGQRGETIMLTDAEAQRLTDLEAVKPADEPLSYDEMNDKQLDAAVKAAGVKVTSSSADSDRPLRGDKIAALLTFDQGRGVAQT